MPKGITRRRAKSTAYEDKAKELGAKRKEAIDTGVAVCVSRQRRRSDTDPDWGGTCEVCGASPIVPATGMCGPCTFGEADTAGGNW